jgi:hypothetical protein
MTTSRIWYCCLAGAFCSTGLTVATATSNQFQVYPSRYKLVQIAHPAKIRHAPQIRDAYGNSTNWAGYAAETNLSTPTLGSVTYAYGGWTVPKVTGVVGGEAAYSSAWVGIDGFEDAQLEALFSGLPPAEQVAMIDATETVEQIGTEQDWTGTGASYYAWFEFFPNDAYEIEGFTVKPGDGIAASVTYLGSNQWQCKLENFTRKETVTITATFTADRYSAEWIIEAPSDEAGVLPLADFGSISFGSCAATLNGKYLTISKTSWEALDMVEYDSTVLKASTSSLNAAGGGFSVKWLSN